jgi:YidC/Oxa1 family membrane protein insertase
MWDTLIINPMLNSLLWIYSVLGNFGIAIILFTLLVRLLTHPLMVQQMKGTQKMTSLQKSPEWVELNRKYKDDKQKLQQEQMALYKTMGINPFGSCLPTLIQFPIIIGLYQSITRALAVTPVAMVDLSRHVYPFIDISSLLPINQKFLWMDLSQPERLYIFGIGIPVLAIIVVATTFLQSKLMAMPSATPGEQGAQMTKMMNLYMPVLMGWLALTFASGLSLYFVTSNVVTIGQYGAMGKLNLDSLMFWRKPKPVDTKGVIDGKMVNKPKLVTDGKPVVESKPAGGKSTSTNKPSGGSKPLTPKKKKR